MSESKTWYLPVCVIVHCLQSLLIKCVYTKIPYNNVFTLWRVRLLYKCFCSCICLVFIETALAQLHRSTISMRSYTICTTSVLIFYRNKYTVNTSAWLCVVNFSEIQSGFPRPFTHCTAITHVIKCSGTVECEIERGVYYKWHMRLHQP